MRPEVKRWFKIIFCSLMVVFSVSIGFSTWIVPGEGDDVTSGSVKPSESTKVPCAYIDNDDKTLYTIEDALKKAASDSANNIVYVKVGTNPTIESNCEVAAGDTLCLTNGLARVTNEDDIGKATESGGSNLAYDDASKCKNIISIASGVSLTNRGTIEINGVLSGGGGGQLGSGQTSGLYTKISLGEDSLLENYGKIYCFGFIDGKQGKINSYSGSTIELPFVINDFKGGQITSKIATANSFIGGSKKVSYFDMFEINNLFVSTYVYYGATVKCHANIFAKSYFHSSFDLVGTNALFKLADQNSYLIFYADPDNDRVENYTVYGSMTMGTISVGLGDVEVSSDSFDLPFSYRQHIVCMPYFDGSSSNVTLPHYYKLLPGSYFKIEKGVTLNCQNRLYVYNKGQFYQDDVGGLKYTSAYLNSPCTFIVNGNFSSKEFGGVVQTECAGATIRLTSSASASVNEHTDSKYLGKLLSKIVLTSMKADFQYYPYSNGQVSTSPTNGSKNVTYTSKGNASIGYGFE